MRFHRVPLAPGMRWTTQTRAESFGDDGTGNERVATYLSEYNVEVLSAQAGVPTRVRVHFARSVDEVPGATLPRYIHGKTYVVDAQGPTVEAEGGGAAPPHEAERVLDVFADIGTRMRVDEALPETPMRIGDRCDGLASAILRILNPRSWKEESATATLARVEGPNGVFAFAFEASTVSGMLLKLEGQAWVRMSDARLVQARGEGTFRIIDADPETRTSRFRVERITTER